MLRMFWRYGGGAGMAFAWLPAVLYADIVVQSVQGVPQVSVISSRVAVFQPRDNEVWVIGEQAPHAVQIPPPGTLNSAWRVEQLKVQPGQGVRVIGVAPRRWFVSKTAAQRWRIGAGTGKPVPVAAAGVVSAMVMARDGAQFAVGMVDGRVARGHGKGQQMVLAGQVQQDLAPRDAGAAVAIDLAAVEASLDRLEPAAGPETPRLPEAAGGRVTAVRGPQAQREELAPLQIQAYQPGQDVSFTVPAGWQWHGPALIPITAVQRRVDQVMVDDAVTQAVAAVSATVVPEPAEVAAVAKAAVPAQTAVPALSSLDAQPVVWPRDGQEVAALQQARAQTALTACLGVKGKMVSVAHDAPAEENAAAEDGGHAAKKEEGPDPNAPGKAALAWTFKDYLTCGATAPVSAVYKALAAAQLANGLGAEALATLQLLPQAEGGPADAEGRWLQAVAQVQRRDNALALATLDGATWPQAWKPQVMLWRAAALQGLGRDGAALDAWPRQNGLLAVYPQPLRLVLQRAIAEAQVAVGEPKAAQAFVDKLADGFAAALPQHSASVETVAAVRADAVPPWLLRLQGLVRLGGAQEREGLELLAKAANQNRDSETAALAKYAFVEALMRRGEIARPQAIAYLDELRLYWRGDDLEKRILGQLGDLYLAEGDYRNALDSWKLLAKADPDSLEMGNLTQKMTDALLQAFDPEKGVTYSPLVFAGLYYDYKELLPADARGDQVTERAGDLMGEMGLYNRAVPLYEQLLKFGQGQAVDQARVALKLAGGYRQNGNAAAALQTLDAYEKQVSNDIQRQQWKLEDARALAVLNRYPSAMKAVSGVQSAEAEALRAEIAWQQQDWNQVRNALDPAVAKLSGRADPDSSGTVPLDVLRLAYANLRAGESKAASSSQVVNGNAPQLAHIVKTFQPLLKQDQVAGDLVAAMAGEAGVSGTLPTAPGRPLGEVAVTLRDMNALSMRTLEQRSEEIETRDERDDYNAKMRYMELLPPPAI